MILPSNVESLPLPIGLKLVIFSLSVTSHLESASLLLRDMRPSEISSSRSCQLGIKTCFRAS